MFRRGTRIMMLSKSPGKRPGNMKETEKRVEVLKQDNNKMEERIKLLSKELVFLKNLFLAHETSAHGPKLDDVQFLLEEDVDGEEETKINILNCDITCIMSYSLSIIYYVCITVSNI